MLASCAAFMRLTYMGSCIRVQAEVGEGGEKAAAGQAEDSGA